jgi:hypothetical protein
MFGFGKKVEIEVPDGKGGLKKVKVSQTQFNRWVAEGRISEVEGFKAHISDPMRGNHTENWVVGRDLPREMYDEFKDENGDVYVMVVYEAGQPKMHLFKKENLEQLEEQINQEVDKSTEAIQLYLREKE